MTLSPISISAVAPKTSARLSFTCPAGKLKQIGKSYSATASKIKISAITNKIESISDFQIVNGGQTTATIHYTHKIDKTDIDKVNVAVKITAIKKNENYGKIVSQISAAANSQTAISKSDFISNDPFLIEIERLSLKNPIFLNCILELILRKLGSIGWYSIATLS